LITYVCILKIILLCHSVIVSLKIKLIAKNTLNTFLINLKSHV